MLQKLVDLDLSWKRFPYLGIRVTGVALGEHRVPARLMRVGFVGELGYEIHVPAEYGTALWEHLLADGRGVRHPAVRRRGAAPAAPGKGPHHRRPGHRRPDQRRCDAGMEWAVKMDKPFFVGQRSLQVIEQATGPAAQLVGFTLDDGAKDRGCRNATS